MFERFTEKARRTLFFARCVASERGGVDIQPEDLLRGAIVAAPELLQDAVGDVIRPLVGFDTEELMLLRFRSRSRTLTPTTQEIPFSAAAKRVLHTAAVEADQLDHVHIRPAHLLLGLLREEGTDAWTMLRQAGLDLRGLRQTLAESGDTGDS
jgi:ATP-dependent Clp protease ATP-binding subunit ClpC